MPSAWAAFAAGLWASAVAGSARTATATATARKGSRRQRRSISGRGNTGGWDAMRSGRTKRPRSAGGFVVGQRRAEAQEANGATGQRPSVAPDDHALHDRAALDAVDPDHPRGARARAERVGGARIQARDLDLAAAADPWHERAHLRGARGVAGVQPGQYAGRVAGGLALQQREDRVALAVLGRQPAGGEEADDEHDERGRDGDGDEAAALDEHSARSLMGRQPVAWKSSGPLISRKRWTLRSWASRRSAIWRAWSAARATKSSSAA